MSNNPARLEGNPAHRRGAALAWQVLLLAAVTSVALQLTATVISVATSDGEFRVAGALFSGGFVLLRGAVARGVWSRARWSLWTGGVIAVLTTLAPLLLLVRIVAGTHEFAASGALTATLAWALALANVTFLAGLAMLRFPERFAGLQKRARGLLRRR
jgi:hypothetical protein